MLYSRFAQKFKHIFFVCFYARLIERINTQHVAGDAAGFLKEVDELAEIVLVDSAHANVDYGHASVVVGHLCALGGFLVDLVDAFPGYVVETVEIIPILGDYAGMVGLVDFYYGFKNVAFAVLYELSH